MPHSKADLCVDEQYSVTYRPRTASVGDGMPSHNLSQQAGA